ncbi:MAG TPA: chemotaxis protein CheW [Terriglobales bacterium]|jgi:chemotaxis signal transduction protein
MRIRTQLTLDPAQHTFLIATVGGFSFAFPAAQVEEVRSLDALISAPDSASEVIGSTVRRGQKLPVVDAAAVFGVPHLTSSRIVLLRHSDVAVGVTAVDRIRSGKLLRLPLTFSGSERHWYSALTLCDGNIAPLIRPEGLLPQAHHLVLSTATVGASL